MRERKRMHERERESNEDGGDDDDGTLFLSNEGIWEGG